MSPLKSDAQRNYRMFLLLGMGAMVLLSLAGLALMVSAIKLQNDAAAYITGESIWSKGISQTIFQLDSYAETGSPEHLQDALQALQIPLSARAARIALEQQPPDRERARQGFIDSGNDPAVTPGLIRLFLYFSWAPEFGEAVELWHATDQDILRLQQIASQLQQQGATEADAAMLRQEIAEIQSSLHEKAGLFSEKINDSVAWLERTLITIAIIGGLVFTVIIGIIFYQVLGWLRARDRRFIATFEQAGIGMAQISTSGAILDVNPALCKTLRSDRATLQRSHIRDILHPADLSNNLEHNRELMEGRSSSYTIEQRCLRGDKSEITAKLTSALTRDANGHPEQFIWIIEDISDTRRLSEKLSYQASHDDLTRLLNRRETERQLVLALESARREQIRHVLCVVDIDQFKIINDTCGHLAGDELLRQYSAMLRERLREKDSLGRIGGDEFAIILHDCNLEQGIQAAEKLRQETSSFEFQWQERNFFPSVSIGLVEISAHAEDVNGLLRAADTACHLAKDMGRNRVHAYVDSDETIARHHSGLHWLGNLQSALDNKRLVLFAQQIVCLDNSHGLRYEVLVRLMDEHGKIFPPNEFLPTAERYGLISRVDQQVLELTIQFLVANPEHLEALECCHINVSGISIGNREYRDFLTNTLDSAGIPKGKLCFEITETAAMENLQEAWKFFQSVQDRGYHIALDDFGSGLSSFSYLRGLPASILKIDGSFVRDITSDPQDEAVVRAINDVSRTLGKSTVAEFVESDAALEMLRGMEVTYAQGYAIHRPGPITDILKIRMPVAEAGHL